jgi:hypothetical protein
VQVQQGAVEAQMQKNQVEALKVASTERIRVAELAQKERELELKAQIEALKGDLVALKSERDQSSTQAKLVLDSEIAAREQELKAAQLRLENSQESASREVDMYKALLQSSTTLTTEQMKIANSGQPGAEMQSLDQRIASIVQESAKALTDAMAAQFGEVQAQMQEQREAARAPKVVKRDGKGLIVAIGDAAVQRDDSGRVVSIG